MILNGVGKLNALLFLKHINKMAIKRNQYNVLYNGDSGIILSDLSKFPDKCVNLIVTSPPYADKRKKSYKGVSSTRYVEWFLPISEQL